MFELSSGLGVIWIEPNYVVSVQPSEYTTPKGRTFTAIIKTLVDTQTVLDPNHDVGKQIAQVKAGRAGELSTIINTLMRPGRRSSNVATPTKE